MLTNPANLDQYPVIDGWVLQRNYRCNYTFQALAVPQYAALRRAGAYKQKQWLVPEDASTILIPARDAYEVELDVGAGSVIWGYQFDGPTNLIIDGQVRTMAFQVRDACNGVSIFSEPMTQQSNTFQPAQVLLTKLHPVGAPGLIAVEITNQTDTDQQAQLVIYGGVPDRG